MISDVKLALNPENHSGKQHHEGSAATCTKPGTKEYWECTDCGKKFSDAAYSTEITDFASYITESALNHNFGTEWKHDREGHWYECTRSDCDAADKGKSETFEAHTLSNVETKPASCTETGVQHKECSVCGYAGADETITKLAHTMEHHARVEADHNSRTNGNVEYWHCTSCNKDYADEAGLSEVTNTVIAWDSIEHSYPNNWSDESANTGDNYAEAADYHYKTCGCGVIIKEAHSFTYVVDKEASCTETGSRHEECTVCGYKKSAETILMKDHTMTHHEAVASTCVTQGNVEYWSCSECSQNYDSATGGNVINDVKLALNPENHAEEAVTAHDEVAAGCTVNGTIAYWECGDCGNAYSDSAMTADKLIGKVDDADFADKIKINALDHDYTEDKYACDGENHWIVCAREDCDDLEGSKKDETVEAHTFGGWAVKTPSTATMKGVQVHSCTVCNYEEEAELPLATSGDSTAQAAADNTVASIIGDVQNGETPEGVDEETFNAIKQFITENGGNCSFSSTIVIVETAASGVPTADKQLVESCAAANGLKVGEYYDVAVYLVGTDSTGKVTTLGKVTQLSAPITLTFNVPDSLAATGRTYYAIRAHDGAAALISSGTTSRSVTASSDKFSTYGIGYKDPVKTTPAPASNSVRTGDENNVVLYVLLMLLSASALSGVSIYRKKKHES